MSLLTIYLYIWKLLKGNYSRPLLLIQLQICANLHFVRGPHSSPMPHIHSRISLGHPYVVLRVPETEMLIAW